MMTDNKDAHMEITQTQLHQTRKNPPGVPLKRIVKRNWPKPRGKGVCDWELVDETNERVVTIKSSEAQD